MKNRLIFLIVLILILLLLASCGKPNAADNTSNVPSKSGPGSVPSNSENDTSNTTSPNTNAGISQPEVEFKDAEVYFTENGEILEIVDIAKQDVMLSEAEVCKLLSDRGFDSYEIYADLDEEGEVIFDEEITATSSERHPIYEISYSTPDGSPWILMVVSDRIIAYPIIFNIQSEKLAATIIVEDDSIISYDNATKRFFVTKPSESVFITKRVEVINADTLAKMTMEELSR